MLNISKLSLSCLTDGVPGLHLALNLTDDSQSLVQFLVILSLTISISLFKCSVLMTSPPTDSAILSTITLANLATILPRAAFGALFAAHKGLNLGPLMGSFSRFTLWSFLNPCNVGIVFQQNQLVRKRLLSQ